MVDPETVDLLAVEPDLGHYLTAADSETLGELRVPVVTVPAGPLDLHALFSAERAFAILRQATERIVATLPEGKRPPSLMMALHMWALSHGIASLFCRADGSRRKLPMSPEDLLEAGVLIYLQSLGLAGGGAEKKAK